MNKYIGSFSVNLFLILFICYALQGVFSWLRAKASVSAIRPDGTEGETNLFSALRYFDDGLQNTVWVFLILGVFLPVILTSMNDVVPLLDNEEKTVTIKGEFIIEEKGSGEMLKDINTSERDKLIDLVGTIDTNDILEEAIKGKFKIVYPLEVNYDIFYQSVLFFTYISIISVIITLEFSYIHNLRNSAPEWTPFLLVSLVLDLTTLLAFILGVKHPDRWTEKLTLVPQVMMLLTAVAALLSSFLVLVLSRTAGALHERQIDFPSRDEIKDEVEIDSHQKENEHTNAQDEANLDKGEQS